MICTVDVFITSTIFLDKDLMIIEEKNNNKPQDKPNIINVERQL